MNLCSTHDPSLALCSRRWERERELEREREVKTGVAFRTCFHRHSFIMNPLRAEDEISVGKEGQRADRPRCIQGRTKPWTYLFTLHSPSQVPRAKATSQQAPVSLLPVTTLPPFSPSPSPSPIPLLFHPSYFRSHSPLHHSPLPLSLPIPAIASFPPSFSLHRVFISTSLFSPPLLMRGRRRRRHRREKTGENWP